MDHAAEREEMRRRLEAALRRETEAEMRQRLEEIQRDLRLRLQSVRTGGDGARVRQGFGKEPTKRVPRIKELRAISVWSSTT